MVGTKVAQYVNLGRMQNQGVDLSLEFDHQFNKDLSLSARGNFTYNRNKKLYDDKPDQIWKYQNLAGFAQNQQFGLIAEGSNPKKTSPPGRNRISAMSVRATSNTATSTATA